MRKIFAAAAAAALTACQQQASAPTAASDTRAAAEAVAALERSQIDAIRAKDAAGATAVYADDAVFIGDNGALAKGAADILPIFDELTKDPNLKLDYVPGPKVFSDDGTMAYATASYTETYTDSASGKPITTKGTNLSVWKKQADGRWKLVADSNSGSIAG